MTRAERDKLTVPEPEYPCAGCCASGGMSGYDYLVHQPAKLRWHTECSDFEAGWYCEDCGAGGDNHETATDIVLADVLAERHAGCMG